MESQAAKKTIKRSSYMVSKLLFKLGFVNYFRVKKTCTEARIAPGIVKSGVKTAGKFCTGPTVLPS